MSKQPSIGIRTVWGSSAGSATTTPFAGGAFFFAPLSAAAAFSAASFLFAISASVSYLSSNAITFGIGCRSSLLTDILVALKASSSNSYLCIYSSAAAV